MMIAELFFRIDIDKILHSRVVYGISEMLGSIGGIELVLIQVAAVVFGEYFKLSFII